MRRIRINKRRRSASRWPEPLSLDLRDSDILRAKQLVSRSRRPGAARRARGTQPDRGVSRAGDRHG
jgi:hypothetical protein